MENYGKRKGIVYLITNDLNDNKYVGVTCQNITTRWTQHKLATKEYHPLSKLYNAMRELGVEHFTIEEIETVDLEFLKEREEYYIDKFDSIQNGYNTFRSGYNTSKMRINEEDVVDFYNQNYGLITLAAKYFNCGVDTIQRILDKHKIERTSDMSLIMRKIVGKKVIQLTTDSKIVNVFDSMIEAEEKTGARYQHIGACCRGQRKTAGGYRWEYGE